MSEKRQLLLDGSFVVSLQQEKQPKETVEQKDQTPKRPLTSYMLFVQDQKNSNVEKHTIGELAKIWAAMPLDYKEKYNQLAIQRKKEYQEQMKNYISVSHDETKGYFPISRIKFILGHDEDKRIVDKTAYVCLQRVTELFGKHLLNKIKLNIQSTGIKQVNEDHLHTVINENQELEFLISITKHNKSKKKHIAESQDKPESKNSSICQKQVRLLQLYSYRSNISSISIMDIQ
ncbi:hypothetical protein pb186bvf_011911 [Paramecium bursaria]